MAQAVSRLYGPAAPGTADAVVVTAGAGANTIVKEIILANTTNAAATVSLGINGTAATAANQIVPTVSVPANTLMVIPLSLVLAAADTIHALQGTAGAITVTISGVTGA